MNYAKGTYINFLDSDDKWDYLAFKHILLFFENHKDIDFVAGRIKFFESKNSFHPLDYKFNQTRIVNLSQEYKFIQLSVSSSVFRNQILKGKYFNENIFFCEDSRFVNKILLVNPLMGLIREALYYYRRRADYSSAIQNQKENLDYYFGTMNSVSNYLINSSKTLYNEIVPFIQFLIIYDILFRITSDAYNYLNSNNLKRYIFLIDNILKQIEDKYFLEQNILTNKYKLFLLSKKYHKDLRYDIKFQNNSFFYLNYSMIDLKTEKYLFVWRRLNIKNNTIYLESLDNFWLPKEYYFYFCRIGNKTFLPKYIENPKYDFITLYGLIEKGRIIYYEIPLDMVNSTKTFYFYISYLGKVIEIFPIAGIFSHIPPISNSYYISENYILKYIKKRLNIIQYNPKKEFEFEKLYCHELKMIKKDYIIGLRNHIKFRNKINYHKNYEVWIINDKRDRAGDNGEYFYRYMKFKKPKGIKTYFAIEKKCSDYNRLKKLGGILDINSFFYKKIFLESDKIFSSIISSWVCTPFDKDQIYILDILHFELIFLNNGIIKDDLTKYLNRFYTNIDIIISSSKQEYDSILHSKYGYDKSNIILSGMPRYDNLQKLHNKTNKMRKIIIIPTWRASIKGPRDLTKHKDIYLEIFKFTDFFKFYNKLINDKRLLLTMKEYNYTGDFCLHPFFENQWIDFDNNEIFSINEKCNYQKLLTEGSLLITDYSSIFFDFAYMKKPIIYTNFDYDEYRITQYEKGNFDYNLDGFGPVCKNIDCIVNETILEIRNNCLLRRKYLKRIERYFTFFDKNNSQRIFEEIIKRKSIIIKYKDRFDYIYPIFLLYVLIYKLIKCLVQTNNLEMND